MKSFNRSICREFCLNLMQNALSLYIKCLLLTDDFRGDIKHANEPIIIIMRNDKKPFIREHNIALFFTH